MVSFVCAKSIPLRGPGPQKGQEKLREIPWGDVFPRQMRSHAPPVPDLVAFLSKQVCHVRK